MTRRADFYNIKGSICKRPQPLHMGNCSPESHNVHASMTFICTNLKSVVRKCNFIYIINRQGTSRRTLSYAGT